MKWRPFIEWRPSEIGIGFSIAVEHVHDYELDKATLRPAHFWCPNIWIHIGPLIAGIGWQST